MVSGLLLPPHCHAVFFFLSFLLCIWSIAGIPFFLDTSERLNGSWAIIDDILVACSTGLGRCSSSAVFRGTLKSNRSCGCTWVY